MKQATGLLNLIKQADRILVTSHVSPDSDALTSLLLAGLTLAQNFPDKEVNMTLEDRIKSHSYLPGYKQIHFIPLDQALNRYKPELIICLDGMNFDRFSRASEKVRDWVKENKPKIVIIDHHEDRSVEKNDLYINQGSPAVVQDIYELFFNGMKLNKPDGYPVLTLTGLFSDTGGFTYKNNRHSATFELIDELISVGGNLEEISASFANYSHDQMVALEELIKNLKVEAGYSYSYLSDDFVRQWVKSGKSYSDLSEAKAHFVNSYVRNIEGNRWGFAVYPNSSFETYDVSLRSQSDVRDVSKIAAKLGGGGHKPAAGQKGIKAKSAQEVVDMVLKAIADTTK